MESKKEKSEKSEKRVNINKDVAFEVWWKAAGRCEFKGCNKALYEHGVTLDKCKIAEFAHIIARSKKGPRGNENSKILAKDPKNIMLLCPECHKYIDNEGKDEYSAEILYAMKQKHEKRMVLLTSLSEDLQAHAVTYGSKIGDQQPDFSFLQIQSALLPNFYPVSNSTIDLEGNWYNGSGWDEYWKREVENLEFMCKDLVLDKINKWECKRIALFGFAPMPLLVRLGTLLNNKHNVEVFQKQRTGNWKWHDDDINTNYIVNKPDVITTSDSVLVLSLSYYITERIKNIKQNSNIWEMTIESPNPDFLKSKKQLYDFGRKVELLLDEINKVSSEKPLHLFMAVPVACAIEFGRVWMQKANNPLWIYDYDKRNGEVDKLAIKIENNL